MLNKSFEFSSSNFDLVGGTRGCVITVHDYAIQDAIDFFTISEVLDQIGKQEVMEYFDLQEKE